VIGGIITMDTNSTVLEEIEAGFGVIEQNTILNSNDYPAGLISRIKGFRTLLNSFIDKEEDPTAEEKKTLKLLLRERQWTKGRMVFECFG